ncbi:pyridoxamine 5'-phosphate oxidase family protein [Streptomyces cinnamoneus]|uniref:pyridoxamine 5'-phosphate oxidase family protein n=1 Tax=Streptomyces cinnamoneus TaxID=53446 RepID=UPI0037BD000C
MNSETTRRTPEVRRRDPADAAGPRRMVGVDRCEALRLLGSVSFGRIVFTQHALPAIRPVNHIVDRGDIVIRTHEGAALVSYTREAGGLGVVVAYEADTIDSVTHLGWSVVATGYARLVTDPGDLARYRAVLRPWVDRSTDFTVRIHPEEITAVRLVPCGG